MTGSDDGDTTHLRESERIAIMEAFVAVLEALMASHRSSLETRKAFVQLLGGDVDAAKSALETALSSGLEHDAFSGALAAYRALVKVFAEKANG